MTPEGYRIERGLLWPATDVGAAQVLFGQVGELERVYRHVAKFDIVVQAGGNCGLWPRALGEKFETVYTFEPAPVNFRCLCANAPAENIYKFNAALGWEHATVDLDMRPDNVGAHKIGGRGRIPMLRIDDLALRDCDLIYLDIEGYELLALHGAQKTLFELQPTVVIEDKGLSKAYCVEKGETVQWLVQGYGYRVAETIGRDVVLVR